MIHDSTPKPGALLALDPESLRLFSMGAFTGEDSLFGGDVGESDDPEKWVKFNDLEHARFVSAIDNGEWIVYVPKRGLEFRVPSCLLAVITQS